MQLAEIDENLCRAELTETQQAEHLQRRKEIWAAMEAAKEQVAQVEPPVEVKKHGHAQPEGFAAETAKATGKSKRSVERSIHRAEAVCQEARDLVRGTPFDKGKRLDATPSAARRSMLPE